MDFTQQRINGFINIDKESGKSSHDVVAAVRRMLNCRAAKRKVGHTGTLDPMATGVLPICVGKATRLAEYITDCRKSYRATIILGIETDSYDAHGAILNRKKSAHITEQDVLALLPQFMGDIWQVPPMVSALKYQGKPLYKLAREGVEIERPARQITIYDVQYYGGKFGDEHPTFEIEVACSRGTYIRSLAHDIGEKLSVGGHLQALRRTQVGVFTIDKSYTLSEIEQLVAMDDLSFILPCNDGIDFLPCVTVTHEQAARLVHGISVVVDGQANLSVCRVEHENGILLGIAELKNKILMMKKVLADANLVGVDDV